MNCKLFQLHSKKLLKHYLSISDNHFFNQKYVCSLIKPYIDETSKPRIIEKPADSLKVMQGRLKTLLYSIEVPDNVFSGIKGRSYAQNAYWHNGNKYVYKIDFTAFFPSIPRERVYSFFKDELQESSDIAEFLTNISTVDIDIADVKDMGKINAFLNVKNVTTRNHLISGSPASQILSYMVNRKMFDELQRVCDNNGMVMTIYVDDVTFSSKNVISNRFKTEIKSIVKKYGYQLSASKEVSYSKCYPKVITGAVINKNGRVSVRNSMRRNIKDEFEKLKENPDDVYVRYRLRGLVTSAQQVDKSVFPSIKKFAYDKKYKVK